MKTNPVSALFTVILVSTPLANAESLDLTSAHVQVVGSNSLSLHNIAVDNQFYNAEIELNLDGTYRVISAEQIHISSTAQYEVVFASTWSTATHPFQYPSGLSHFSGLIGTTHSSRLHLWSADEIATPGMERMAESGSKSLLNDEITSAMNEGSAEILLSGGGINPSPGTASLTFQISQANPFVTLVSMIAPSPDWFVGVSALSLIIEGQWVDELMIPLYAYDAGTDNGVNYTSSNSDTNPKGIITRLQDPPFLVDGEIPPLGSFTFRRLSE